MTDSTRIFSYKPGTVSTVSQSLRVVAGVLEVTETTVTSDNMLVAPGGLHAETVVVGRYRLEPAAPAAAMPGSPEATHEALITRARSWTAGDCSFDPTPTLFLLKQLADALESRP